ncbi:tetratricopeptide repeat protein [Sediminitomix flava]|uniref:Tetratricopeptide repeat protein n=1 Tax=Sediminitomix flava TaxID=379075 RepID=A0A315Z8W9_SEDFL|nr:tetratricopeptide repeat protein [Sediminitomix flava]PWJ40889.1 tetratricopeptide repeat protein [Sediminitomix flava]
MREEIQFWKNWSKEDRFPFWIGLQLVIVGLFCTCFFKWQSTGNLIPWNVVSELKQAQISNESFSFFLFDIPIPTTTYVTESYFAAGYFQIHDMVYWLYGILLIAGLSFLLASITELSLMWYLGGVTIYTIFAISLNLDHLLILGDVHPMLFTLIVLLSVLPLSYIFRSIFKTNTLVRVVSFLLIHVVLVFTVASLAQTALPLKTLIVNSTSLPLIAFLVSCVLLAPEIIRGIVYLLTDGRKGEGTGALLHFCVVSGLYILNLVYLYIQYFSVSSLPFFVHIPAILIYAFSVVIGLWGWKKREQHYGNFFPFHTTGAYLYLSVIILSLAFLSISYGSGNSSYTELAEKVIFITYIGFGLAIIGYVISNFNPLLKKQLDVHKVYYLPARLEYSMAILIGVALTLVFGARGYTHTYNQTWAGYYNNKAYLESMKDDLMMAERYYNTSMAYDPKNHFGSYGLSSLGIDHEHYGTALMLLKDALHRSPSPQAFANMGILEWTKNQKLRALYQLQKGINTFENSSELNTNYAYYAKRMNMADSALFYLNHALDHTYEPNVPLSNIYAHAATTPNFSAELPTEKSEKTDFMVKGNQFAALLNQNIPTADALDTLAFEDFDLSSYELFYVCNYLLNKKEGVSDDELKFVEQLELANLGTEDFTFLLYAKAAVLYAKGDVKHAMQHFQHLSETSPNTQNRHDFYYGLRLMEQGFFDKAADAFHTAFVKGHPDALYYLGLAYSESGQKELAKKTWTQIQEIYPENAPIQLMNRLYTEEQPKADDQEYLTFYLHYNNQNLSDKEFENLCGLFQDGSMLTYAWLDRAEYLLKTEKLEQAALVINELNVSEELKGHFTALQLDLEIKTGNYSEEGFNQLDIAKAYWANKSLEQRYLAGYYEHTGEKALAKVAYENAILNSPYDESLYLNYTKLLLEEEGQTTRAYEVILTGVETLDTDELQKQYAFVSLKMGYDGFAEHTKSMLSDRLNDQAFSEFLEEYNQIAL